MSKCSKCEKEITGATYLLPDQPDRAWCSTECRNSQIIPFSQRDKEKAGVNVANHTPMLNLNPKRKITFED